MTGDLAWLRPCTSASNILRIPRESRTQHGWRGEKLALTHPGIHSDLWLVPNALSPGLRPTSLPEGRAEESRVAMGRNWWLAPVVAERPVPTR
jgi:hypothetical protein